MGAATEHPGMSEALWSALNESRDHGFLGPGEIEQHVDRASIIIMLGSDDYFAPDSVPMRCEVTPALAAHARQELVVLWFPVRPVSFAATPVRDIMAATGPSPAPLESLTPEDQANALRTVYRAVLHHLGLPPLSEPLEPQSTKWEPPMLLTRIPEPNDRRGSTQCQPVVGVRPCRQPLAASCR